MSISILLVDDHPIFSSSLKMVLESNSFIVNHTPDANFALKLLKSTPFDVIITDVEMPKMNGVDFIKEIQNSNMVYKKKPKIIVLTSYHKVSLFKKLYALDIDGFLSKNTSQFDLLSTIRKVLTGEKYYEPEIYQIFLNSDLNQKTIEFTEREFQVLKLILEEKTTSEIAATLTISPYTVEGHRKNLLQKTNSKNVVGLIKYTLNNNLF